MGHKGAGDGGWEANPPDMALRRYANVIDRVVGGLRITDEADRAAGFEIAVASRHFTRRTKEVVDDKLSFSATLMRAGEVEAANRLLAEVEDEVLNEEAALLEKVNEVKVARALDRPPVTRMRLARVLAVAVLGSSLLASSAVGMAVAGLFRDRDNNVLEAPGETRNGRRADEVRGVRLALGMKQIRVAGVPMRLTRAELRQYQELTSGGAIDEDRLETFLLSVLPAPLAEKVHVALVVASKATPDDLEQSVAAFSHKVNEERKKATDDRNDDTADEPAKDDQQQPSDDEPSPDHSGSGDDNKDPEDGDGPGDLPLINDDGGS